MSSSSPALPSHLQNIHDDLQHFKHDKWGWVIYRCTYGDDEAWNRFQQIINEGSRKQLDKPDVPQEVSSSLEWTFVSDAATLDNASRDQLRRRFRDWAADAERIEQPRADTGAAFKAQRYRYFIQVDEEVLKTVVEANPSDPSDVGWVNLVRADEEQDFGYHGEDAGESAKSEEDEGWMMIAADMVGPDFYDAIGTLPENWYSFYSPPPRLVVY